jgi:hypothetical protein
MNQVRVTPGCNIVSLRMVTKAVACAIFITLAAVQPVAAERPGMTSGAPSLYVEQFLSLRTSMERLFTAASQANPRSMSSKASLDINERLFALEKMAYRLQEQAAAAHVSALKQGRGTDKRLLLVQQGCMAIDSVLEALRNYLDTNDRFFLGLAADAKQMAASIRKVI